MFLEQIIRPYQSPDAHGTIVIPSTPTGTSERATLTWGAKATMPPVNAGENFSVQCCNENLTEKGRTNQQVRITGPDGESYVDVQRPSQVTLNKKEKNDCDGGWSQMSGAAAAVGSALAEWEADFANVDVPHSCGTTWNLSN